LLHSWKHASRYFDRSSQSFPNTRISATEDKLIYKRITWRYVEGDKYINITLRMMNWTVRIQIWAPGDTIAIGLGRQESRRF
jgi:hypothetical protein